VYPQNKIVATPLSAGPPIFTTINASAPIFDIFWRPLKLGSHLLCGVAVPSCIVFVIVVRSKTSDVSVLVSLKPVRPRSVTETNRCFMNVIINACLPQPPHQTSRHYPSISFVLPCRVYRPTNITQFADCTF